MGLCWSSAVAQVHKLLGKGVNRKMARFADGVTLLRARRLRADLTCRRT